MATDISSTGGRNQLWDFSLHFYAKPGVADACIRLQERLGLDVNLLLAGLWAGKVPGLTLSPDQWAALDAATRDWREKVVKPLRAIRTNMKAGGLAERSSGGPALRESVKSAELEAERIEQDIIFNLISDMGTGSGAGTGGLAIANMLNYVRSFAPEYGDDAEEAALFTMMLAD